MGALVSVKSGLKDVASVSLEAKAAILGALYGLEQLFSKSNQTGTALQNFNAVIGGDTIQTLQKYQYAARQVGISNEETATSFKALQNVATDIRYGVARPSGMAQVQKTVGLTAGDIDEAMVHPEKLLLKLQEYLQKEKNVGLANQVVRSFHLGDNFIAAGRRNAFNPQALASAPTYSNKESSALDKENIAWANLQNKIEMAIGHFNAKHGTEIVNEISQLVNTAIVLAENLMKLSEGLHAFSLLNDALKGVNVTVSALVGLTGKGSATEKLGKAVTNPTNEEGEDLWQQNKNSREDELRGLGKARETGSAQKPGSTVGQAFKGFAIPGGDDDDSGIASQVQKFKGTSVPGQTTPSPLQNASNPAPNITNSPSSENSTQNVTVNQTLNFPTNTSKPDDHAKAVDKAVKDAFRQLPSQKQGS